LNEFKSTLPNTESIGPDTAIRSPKLSRYNNIRNRKINACGIIISKTG